MLTKARVRARSAILLLALIGLLLVPPTPQKAFAAGPVISAVGDNRAAYANGQVPQHAKFELSFGLETVATNLQFPFDPEPPAGIPAGVGISVNGLFSDDNWASTTVQPGFLFQDYRREYKSNVELLHPQGSPVWKVRFAPPRAGNWRFRIRATDATGTSYYPQAGDLSFTAVPSGNPGFIRVSASDPRYFEFDDGTPFVGVGHGEGFDGRRFTYDVDEKMAKFAASRANFFRVWMSGSAIVGAAWQPWTSHHLPYEGYLPATSLTVEEAFGSGDVSMKLSQRNPCMYQQLVPVQPGKTYRVQARVKTVGVSGPATPGKPYGFVLKQTGWIGSSCGQPDSIAPLTPYLNGDSEWQTVTGIIAARLDQRYLDGLYLILENAAAGAAYLDEVSVREDLGNGQLGPEVIRKGRMNMHTYFDQVRSWDWDYALEKAEQSGVYLKIVVMEKADWIYNHFDWEGNKVATGTENSGNANFYGDPANPNSLVRRYQEYYWRYLAARWGYSTAVHSWELVNEGDPYNGNHYAQADYFAQTMHRTEPARHLVTTSFWAAFPAREFWGNPRYPNIDYADVHAYISTGGGNYEWNLPSAESGPAPSLENRPEYTVGAGGYSLNVPAGTVTRSKSVVVSGQGTWTIRFTVKGENITGSCPYGAPASLAGPQLHWQVDGLTGTGSRGVAPFLSGQPYKYYVCTSPAGTFDWTDYETTVTLPDDGYYGILLWFSMQYATLGTAWFDNLQIISPDGRAARLFGDGTFDDRERYDYDSALFTWSRSVRFGAQSVSGAKKPLVRGETGIDSVNQQLELPELASDVQGIWLHNLLWGQVNPGGMYDLYWWADNIRRHDLYWHFKPYRDFMEGIPFSNGTYVDADAITSNRGLRAWGQKTGTAAHLWIQNVNHTWKNVVDGVAISAIDGMVVVPSMRPGSYDVEWRDTYTGAVVKRETIVVVDNLTLTLPAPLSTDLAVRASQKTGQQWTVHIPVVVK